MNLDKYGRCKNCACLVWIDKRSRAALAKLHALAAVVEDLVVMDSPFRVYLCYDSSERTFLEVKNECHDKGCRTTGTASRTTAR
jgi:hypothetical protein